MCDYIFENWQILLDVASKGATVIAAIGIAVAYWQYRHSVNLAKANERRAAVELAARECTHFGRQLLPEMVSILKQIEDSGSQYLAHCKLIREEKKLKLDASAATETDLEPLKPIIPKAIDALNLLEGFAIPFAQEVADNEVGFIECGRSFVDVFEKFFPLYGRVELRDYYRSSQVVYWRWKTRIEQEERDRRHAQATKEFILATERQISALSGSWIAQKIAAKLRGVVNRLEGS